MLEIKEEFNENGGIKGGYEKYARKHHFVVAEINLPWRVEKYKFGISFEHYGRRGGWRINVSKLLKAAYKEITKVYGSYGIFDVVIKGPIVFDDNNTWKINIC